jgi:hypothetical protein
MRKKIGNLYSNINSNRREALICGPLFYILRCVLVMIVVLSKDGGFQWTLIELVLLANCVYLLGLTPYTSKLDAFPEFMNSVMLVL